MSNNLKSFEFLSEVNIGDFVSYSDTTSEIMGIYLGRITAYSIQYFAFFCHGKLLLKFVKMTKAYSIISKNNKNVD